MWKTAGIAWSFLTQRQKALLVGLSLSRIVANLFDLAGIAAIGLLVMALASGRVDFSIGSFYRIRFDETPIELIVGLVALAAGSFLLKAVLSMTLNLMILRVLVGAEVRSSRRILAYILGGPLSELKKYSRGDLQFASNFSTTAMFSGILGAVSNVIAEIALMLMIAGAFFLVNPTAALVVTGYILALVAIIQWVLNERLKRLGRDVTTGSVESTGVVFDAVEAFREIAVLRKQEFFLRKFADARWLLGRTRAQEIILRTIPRVIIEQALMLGVLAFVGWQLLASDVSSGLASVGVFVAGAVRIMGAVLPVQTSFATMKSNQVKAEKAIDILLKDRVVRAETAMDRKRPENLQQETQPVSHGDQGRRGVTVEVRDVSFRFPDADQDTLSGITLTVKAGSFVAFVGPSGAGKTTLVDLILGLNTATGGEVLLDGLAPTVLAGIAPGMISYVPQRPGMVQGSVAENIALGVEPELIDLQRVWECLDAVDLRTIVEALPDGVHTSMGKQADGFSGGQIQRLGLARALYPGPRLIALDEATSALDAGAEAEVTKSIRALRGHVTVIVIAHRLSTIQDADNVFAIDGGRLVGQGPFKKLRKDVPLIEEYVRLMSFED